MSSEWGLALKNILFPIFCHECGCRLLTEENSHFCPSCWELSPRIERPFCTVCGQPQQGRVGFGDTRNIPCAECREQAAPPYRRVYGAAYYEGPIAQAIKLFKFDGKTRLGVHLAEVMAEFAEGEMDCGDYDNLVPVPLHKVRRRERGFNQATELANHLADTFPHAPIDESLTRIRPTRVQSKIKDNKARRANVIGAFAVERASDFEGRRVLLIDDVVTTGGTVAECAAALERAGAAAVDVFATALPVKKTAIGGFARGNKRRLASVPS